jgi:hypothetical protein
VDAATAGNLEDERRATYLPLATTRTSLTFMKHEISFSDESRAAAATKREKRQLGLVDGRGHRKNAGI